MMNLASKVIASYQGRTIATAESLTGGGIGAALTAVPGSSAVYKGGIISYTNEIKNCVLGVPQIDLETYGAVSAPVARAMAEGARRLLKVDAAVAVTGLAGPTGDEFENPVGTVFIGCCNGKETVTRKFCFAGDRESIRNQTITEALRILLES